ncbi:MAG: hypothetical protein NQU46_07885 [Methanolinea sp.]|nr:hypothetical protein [Methanolinea sp.]
MEDRWNAGRTAMHFFIYVEEDMFNLARDTRGREKRSSSGEKE